MVERTHIVENNLPFTVLNQSFSKGNLGTYEISFGSDMQGERVQSLVIQEKTHENALIYLTALGELYKSCDDVKYESLKNKLKSRACHHINFSEDKKGQRTASVTIFPFVGKPIVCEVSVLKLKQIQQVLPLFDINLEEAQPNDEAEDLQSLVVNAETGGRFKPLIDELKIEGRQRKGRNIKTALVNLQDAYPKLFDKVIPKTGGSSFEHLKNLSLEMLDEIMQEIIDELDPTERARFIKNGKVIYSQFSPKIKEAMRQQNEPLMQDATWGRFDAAFATRERDL